MKINIVNINTLNPTEVFVKIAKATEVFAGDDDAFRCQIIELLPRKAFDPHVHISIHIIYVLEGCGSLTIWDHEENENEVIINRCSHKTFQVSKGDLFIIPKNVMHAMSAGEDEKLKELIINIPGIALHDHRRIIWRE